MKTSAYLDRIAFSGTPAATPGCLRDLQLAHLQAIPFENLDIHLGREILLDEERFFQKLVRQRRGGFCYEQNGLFAVMLRAFGFEVTVLSASVARNEGGFGGPFDHMTLQVRCPGSTVNWLADVGFGDAFREPLLLDEPGEQRPLLFDDGRAYRITRQGEFLHMEQRETGGPWAPRFRFILAPRSLTDFVEACRFQQTSPESNFTRRRIVTRATPRGRVTLADLRLISTEDGRRTERQLESDEEYRSALQRHFGICLQDAWKTPA